MSHVVLKVCKVLCWVAFNCAQVGASSAQLGISHKLNNRAGSTLVIFICSRLRLYNGGGFGGLRIRLRRFSRGL